MAQRSKITPNSKNLQVFINCPFDNEYLPLLRPFLFTIIYLGFHPLIASGKNDSGEVRIHKILMLIEQSDLSIHDLSRVQAKNAGDFFRLNMPFEFGIDWGYRHFNNPNKPFLVLEADKHTASRGLSDFSGCDPESHENDPELLVRVVRNWLQTIYMNKNLPGASDVWDQYNFFYSKLYEKGNYSDKDIQLMTVPEFIQNIYNWKK